MHYVAEVKFYGPTNTRGSRWRVRLPGARIGDPPIVRWVPRRHEHSIDYDVWRAVLEACLGTPWRQRALAGDGMTVFVGADPDTYYVVLQARETE